MRILSTVLVVLGLCCFAMVSHAAEENVLHVKSPAPGEHVVVPCGDAKRIIFDFESEEAKCELSENNIVFHHDNGTSITLGGILPSDGNSYNVRDVVLQFGQSGASFRLRDLVMAAGKEWKPALGPRGNAH